ncbi:MAG: hypothetical protein ACYC7D_12075 [Nitrososphaerales archaeon]
MPAKRAQLCKQSCGNAGRGAAVGGAIMNAWKNTRNVAVTSNTMTRAGV